MAVFQQRCIYSQINFLFYFRMFNNQYGQNPQQMNQPVQQQGQQMVGQQQQQMSQQMQAAAQQNMQQQPQQQVHEIDDPIIQIKKMVPKLKESLNSVMTISAKVLEFNSRVDYTGADQSRPPSVDQNIQTRRDLENSFEDFYHTADMLEAQIKLAQQQCMNTLQAVSTVGPQYVHLLPRGMPGAPAGMSNFELSRYNEYIDIVKDQISCATEASEILQSSYRNLRKIDVPGQQRRSQNTNNQNNRPGSGGPQQGGPQSPAVSSPGMAQGPGTPGSAPITSQS